MSEKLIVGVYNSLEEAESAVEELDKHGFPIAHISIVAKEFEDAETYIDYNVDNGLYTFRCEKNFSDIMGRFQQYQIEKNQSDSNLTSPSSDIAP